MSDELEFLRGLPKEEALRIAYIKDREDLFRTRFFQLESEYGEEELPAKHICVLSRDPGSGNALAPVMHLMQKEQGMRLSALSDGRAEEIFRKQFSIVTQEPEHLGLDALNAIDSSDLFLTGPSEEPGIEMAAVAAYPEVPLVLVEVYYGDSLRLFKRLIEHELPLPARVCVMDEEAARINIEHFPELKDRIRVTGHPAMDRFANEDTEAINRRTREHIGVTSKEKLVVWMATIDMNTELLRASAQELAQSKIPFKVIFRRHPRDNTKYEAYRAVLAEAGLEYIDTQELLTDEVGAAADLVLTTTSTEGLNAIYRRKPSIHINDERYKELYPGIILPLPQVHSGASIGTQDVKELPLLIDELLDPASQRNVELRRVMEARYPRDGKNAQRVVDVVKEVLAEKV